MERISPIIILGPSTIGKSALANALARAGDAHIITADKYYLYASSTIMLGVGLTPEDMQSWHAPRLLGSLAPDDSLPSPEAYVNMAEAQVDEVQTAGGLAVLEGCSVSYGRALVERFGALRTMRLTWQERYPVHLALEVQRAYQKLLDLGLYSETEQNLDLGLENTYPMSSLIYKPTALALQGKVTRQQADELVVTKWIDEAIRADQAFAQMGIASLLPKA